MGGQHADGAGGMGDDGLPGSEWQPAEEPHPDGSAPAGDGQHRDDEDQ